MENYFKLFDAIKGQVSRNHSVETFFGHPETADEIRVYIRSSQILILECVLHEYRRNHSTIYEPLDGICALHHLIFSRTNWTFDTIRSAPIPDLILCIQDLITLDGCPPAVQELVKPNLPNTSYAFAQFDIDDWNISENAKCLTLD